MASLLFSSQLMMPITSFAETINTSTSSSVEETNEEIDSSTTDEESSGNEIDSSEMSKSRSEGENNKNTTGNNKETNTSTEKESKSTDTVSSGTNGTSDWTFENGTLTFAGGNLTQKISTMTEIDPQTITKIVFAGRVTIPSLYSETDSFFANLSNLVGIDNGSNLDFSNVPEPYYLFRNDSKLEYIDTSNWNTNNMIRTTGMFLGCSSLQTVDVSNWNTSNVVDLGNMFNGCNAINNLDVSNWDTSNVANMDKLFYATNSLTQIDVSNWNTSKVTNMSQMFFYSGVDKLDLSNWDTRNNTYAGGMLTALNLKQVTLGKNVILTSSHGTADIPDIQPTDKYTGNWQTVGSGTIDNPLGDIVIDGYTLSTSYDGSTMSGIYVWQPVTLIGTDYTMYVGDPTPTVSDFEASATDKNGNPIAVTADFSKVDFSNAGTYDVVLAATDGQTKTVKLTVKENKQTITGSDYTMYPGDKEATVSDFNAFATDKEGSSIDVTADFSKVDFSNVGTYDVVLTAADGQTKTVKLIVKENKQTITVKDSTIYVGDTWKAEDNFVSATDKEGQEAAFSEITVTGTVDTSKAGDYTVTYTNGAKEAVATITVLAKPGIEASDKTMYVGDTLTKEAILSWATFTNAEGYMQGFEVVGTSIPVSSSDKLTTAGEYKIKYYVEGKARAADSRLAEKEITLTVVKKSTGTTDPTYPTKVIGSGSTGTTNTGTGNTSSSKSLPSTGEQQSNVFYVIGSMLVVAAGALYVWIKKEKQKKSN